MPPQNLSPWKDIFLVDCYEFARQGLPRADMARLVGVSYETFRKWWMKKSALREAVRRGRTASASSPTSRNEDGESFFEYVYKRLPADLQRTWNELQGLFDEKKDTPSRIECLLSGHNEAARMHLFFHSLASSGFIVSRACRKINLNKFTLDKWMTDPRFKDLLDEFTKYKKDFFESALIRKVREGDTSAILFCNRTVNADRGYNPKVVVQHEGNVNHLHQTFELEQLIDLLPIDTARVVLDTMRAIKEGKPPPKVVKALQPHDDGNVLSEPFQEVH